MAFISRFLFILFLLAVPVLTRGECTCDKEGDEINKSEALKYKLAAFASILVAGAIGVLLPMLGKTVPSLSPEKDIFLIIKAFAAGVILSTGFIHVLPDAFEDLTSPCLPENPWGHFPFTGFVAMVSAIGTLMVDSFATSYYKRLHFNNAQTENGHAHGSLPDNASSDLLRHRVISQVLELGIVVHSIIIGISLGASQSPKTIRPLVAALTFHQFFEGMGLGGCISQAKFKNKAVAIMAAFFSLTTPVGIAIGIGISSRYNEDNPNALIVQGVFNAASAGILIYMSLVDLLAADFMSLKMQNNGKLQVGANLSLLFGAGCMSLLAKWA